MPSLRPRVSPYTTKENRETLRESASGGSGVVGGAMARVRSGSWAAPGGTQTVDETSSANRTTARCFSKNTGSHSRLERSAALRLRNAAIRHVSKSRDSQHVSAATEKKGTVYAFRIP